MNKGSNKKKTKVMTFYSDSYKCNFIKKKKTLRGFILFKTRTIYWKHVNACQFTMTLSTLHVLSLTSYACYNK